MLPWFLFYVQVVSTLVTYIIIVVQWLVNAQANVIATTGKTYGSECPTWLWVLCQYQGQAVGFCTYMNNAAMTRSLQTSTLFKSLCMQIKRRLSEHQCSADLRRLESTGWIQWYHPSWTECLPVNWEGTHEHEMVARDILHYYTLCSSVERGRGKYLRDCSTHQAHRPTAGDCNELSSSASRVTLQLKIHNHHT